MQIQREIFTAHLQLRLFDPVAGLGGNGFAERRPMRVIDHRRPGCQRSSACAPSAAAMPSITWRILSGIWRRTASLWVRTVPSSSTVCGSTFQVLPPSMRVTLTTSDSSELKLRLGSVCRAPTIWLAVTMVSTPCSGLAACALAGDEDLEAIDVGVERPGAGGEGAGGQLRRIMQAKHRGDIIQRAGVDQVPGAVEGLFRRLEEEAYRAGQVGLTRFQQVCGAEHH